MNPATPETGSALIRTHKACEAFETAWQAGGRPRVEDFCAGPGGAPDLVVAVELIGLDVYYREQAGESPTADDYAGRFPGLGLDQLAPLVGGLPPGRELPAAGGQFGRFTLLERVGAGACGAVWRAYDTALGRVVALKFPHPGIVASVEALERFRREARVTARLRHPGVVTVHEVADIDGLPVLVEEFVAGESLRDRLAREKPTPREATALAADLADALDYAHRHGAVHRDVKPGNVVIPASPGTPVLVDFGLAADGPGGDLTADGELVGTPAYMSPEQARGDAQAADARTDVYALGVVLYEMLTGRPPFHGSRAMLLRQVVEDEPRPPRRLDERIPRDLETVCLQAMAKEPARRYRSAAEFAADLRRFLAGDAVKARPTGPVERTVRWARRKPTAAALLGVSLTAAGTIVGGGVWHNASLASANAELAAAVDRERESAGEATRRADVIRSQAEAGRRSVYAMTLSQVPTLWRRDPLRVHSILCDPAVCPTDLRDFTWQYFDRFCDLGDGELAVGVGPTTAMAMTPDGRKLVTGAADGAVRVWDLDARRVTATDRSHAGAVTAVALLPDGQFATGGVDGKVMIRSLATGAIECVLASHQRAVYALEWVESESRLASGGDDKTVRLWDVANRQEVASWPDGVGSVRALVALPEKSGLVVAGPGAVGLRVADPVSGATTVNWTEGTGPTQSLAVSPDGRLLAQGFRKSQTYIREVATGRVVRRFGGHVDAVKAVRFSPDGRLLATGGDTDGDLRLWDVKTGEQWTNLGTKPTRALAFGPGGRLVSATERGDGVSVWRLPPYPEPVRFRLAHPKDATAVAEHGGRVAVGTADGEVRVWDAGANDAVAVPGTRREIRALAWSPDGRVLAFGAEDTPSVFLWDGNGPPITLNELQGPALGATFHPNGELLVVASRDHTIRVWNLVTRQTVAVLRDHTEAAKATAFSPDGSLLVSVGDDGAVRLWDVATWKPLGVLGRHEGWALSVAFDPTGRFVATGGRDKVVRVWDVAGRKERFSAAGFSTWVYSVRYSADGKTLMTATGVPFIGSPHGEVRLLDPETGYVRAALEGYASPMTLTTDGTALLAAVKGGVAELRAGR